MVVVLSLFGSPDAYYFWTIAIWYKIWYFLQIRRKCFVKTRSLSVKAKAQRVSVRQHTSTPLMGCRSLVSL